MNRARMPQAPKPRQRPAPAAGSGLRVRRVCGRRRLLAAHAKPPRSRRIALYCTFFFFQVSIMWFKNLVFYRLPAQWAVSASELEGLLAGRTLQACGPFQMSCRGWVPVTTGGRLLHVTGQQYMVALGINEKLLPGSIVRQVAEERAQIQAHE